MAAQHLTTGRAVGVDLWRSVDQSGNSAEATRRNAVAEGVADRVELHTGDMTALPFEDNSFDVVVSSLAIHNISGRAGREKAIDEAVRVLRPGGRLMIADVRGTRQHQAQLAKIGMNDVARRRLGWRFWWGGPWAANPSRDRHEAGTSELRRRSPRVRLGLSHARPAISATAFAIPAKPSRSRNVPSRPHAFAPST